MALRDPIFEDPCPQCSGRGRSDRDIPCVPCAGRGKIRQAPGVQRRADGGQLEIGGLRELSWPPSGRTGRRG